MLFLKRSIEFFVGLAALLLPGGLLILLLLWLYRQAHASRRTAAIELTVSK